MPKLTIVIGLLLVALGVYAYAAAGSGSTYAAPDQTAVEGQQAPPADAIPSPEAEAAADLADEHAEAEASGGKRSITALIPAFIGAPILLLGLIALNDGPRKHAMHGALVFALLGTLGGLGMGLPALPKVMAGEHERPKAVYSQIGMGVPCAILLVAGINSFVSARRRRQAEAAPTGDA